jgi:hypothetical protein
VKPARRRVRTDGGDPPPAVLDDGHISFIGPRAARFLDWLRVAQPEIDAIDDLFVGALLAEIDDWAVAATSGTTATPPHTT